MPSAITERINPFPTKKYDLSNVIGKYKAAVTRSVGNAFMHSACADPNSVIYCPR